MQFVDLYVMMNKNLKKVYLISKGERRNILKWEKCKDKNFDLESCGKIGYKMGRARFYLSCSYS